VQASNTYANARILIFTLLLAFAAENTVYHSKLQNGDREKIKSEKELFSRACTLPGLR
jgi:hypothetical protein